ncbi:MAG: hypothetical protein LBE56_12265 [Tannerella sp.]|jgi:hypothetical protein|nr:hypothetical protein [Tannerella sp.]
MNSKNQIDVKISRIYSVTMEDVRKKFESGETVWNDGDNKRSFSSLNEQQLKMIAAEHAMDEFYEDWCSGILEMDSFSASVEK